MDERLREIDERLKTDYVSATYGQDIGDIRYLREKLDEAQAKCASEYAERNDAETSLMIATEKLDEANKRIAEYERQEAIRLCRSAEVTARYTEDV